MQNDRFARLTQLIHEWVSKNIYVIGAYIYICNYHITIFMCVYIYIGVYIHVCIYTRMVGYDTFIRVTWLIYECEMFHPHVMTPARPYESCKIFKGRPRRNAFSKLVHRQYKSWYVHTCDSTHLWMWHVSSICETWLIHVMRWLRLVGSLKL